jgi:hypothetical protein
MTCIENMELSVRKGSFIEIGALDPKDSNIFPQMISIGGCCLLKYSARVGEIPAVAEHLRFHGVAGENYRWWGDRMAYRYSGVIT